MRAIHIINKLTIATHQLCAKGANGRIQPVHLRQGDMDGACAIYSLMMAMITCGIINRKDAEGLYKRIDGRSSLGRLLKKLTVYNDQDKVATDGLVRNGLFLDHVDDVITHNCKRIMTSVYSDDINNITGIVSHLKNNDPVIIGTTYRGNKGGHALLAIGYETENDIVSKLFCLDPGYPLSECSYWNAIIHMNSNTGREYTHYYVPSNVEIKIDETICIYKKNSKTK